VLVGGSSRIPPVGEMLQGAFEVPLSVDTHPKHDVALGAALTDASGGPPSSELSGQPTAAELLTHVPADFRNTCQVDDKDVRGAALKLVCHPTGDPISTIYLWQYASSAEFGAAVDKTFTVTEKSDCSSGQARITMSSRPRVARHGPAFCSARRSHR
jgi:hypothetical protein